MTSKGMLLVAVASMLAPFACVCVGQDGPKATPSRAIRPTNEWNC